MMIKNIAHIILVPLALLCLSSCDSNQEKHRKTLEERLVDSFSASENIVRERVDVIVSASKDQDYVLAMNELAILSATQQNNPAQKQAINLLMNQLRFNMEEAEFTARSQRQDN